MKTFTTALLVLLVPAVLLAQAPPATQTAPPPPKPAAPAPAAPVTVAPASGPSRVAVIDIQRAVTENSEGKKAAEKFLAEMTKRQSDLEGKQKAIQEMQNKLQTQDKALSDSAKADLARNIERQTTDLNRTNEDAQRELEELRNTSLRPIAEKVNRIVSAYAAENGFTIVFDVAQSGVIFASDVSDITTEIIRRYDAELAKAAPKTPGKQ